MKTPDDILSRAEAEIAAGRAWRAKEIFRGTIAAGCTEPAVLEGYGLLLETLGDRLEAGKYLFLSGVRRPAYDLPITLFLERYSRTAGADFARQLPLALRRRRFDELPPPVQEELARRGVRASAFGKMPRVKHVRVRLKWTQRLLIGGALLVTLFFFVALARGVWEILAWIWTLVD